MVMWRPWLLLLIRESRAATEQVLTRNSTGIHVKKFCVGQSRWHVPVDDSMLMCGGPQTHRSDKSKTFIGCSDSCTSGHWGITKGKDAHSRKPSVLVWKLGVSVIQVLYNNILWLSPSKVKMLAFTTDCSMSRKTFRTRTWSYSKSITSAKQYGKTNVGTKVAKKALHDWCELCGVDSDRVNNMWARKTFIQTGLKDLQLPAPQIMEVSGHKSEVQMRNDYCGK